MKGVVPAGEAAVCQRVGLRRHRGRALVPGGLQDAGRRQKALRPDDAAAGERCASGPVSCAAPMTLTLSDCLFVGVQVGLKYFEDMQIRIPREEVCDSVHVHCDLLL